MRRSRREAGEGQFGCLFGLVILVAVLFVAYKLIPVKVKSAEIRQVITDEAKSAGTHNDDRIRKAIIEKATEDNLPITDESIEIVRTGNLIRIDVDYTVPIQFPGYLYKWHQHHQVENPIF